MRDTYLYHVYLINSQDNNVQDYYTKKDTNVDTIQRMALYSARHFYADKVNIYGCKNDDKNNEKLICSFDFNKAWTDQEWEFFNQWEF